MTESARDGVAPQIHLRNLLTQLLERHLAVGADVAQLYFRCDVDAQCCDVVAQHVAQGLRRQTDHLHQKQTHFLLECERTCKAFGVVLHVCARILR